MSRPKLQTVTTVVGIVLLVLMVAASASLIWLTSELREGTELLARNTESVEVTRSLELALLGHSRASGLMMATGDPAQARRREGLEAELETLLLRAGNLTGEDRAEEIRLGATRASIHRYVSRRERLEGTASSLRDLVSAVRPSLDAALSAILDLRAYNEAQMARARDEADAWSRIAKTLGATIAGLMVIFVLGLLLGVRRYVVVPLRDIRQAIARWKAGETRAGAPEEGLRETVDIAQAFNEMSAELARQREAQLTFLAGVAHDLRNPLGALSMAVQTLRARSRGSAARCRRHARLARAPGRPPEPYER